MLKDIHSGRKRNETLRIISLILKVKSIRDGDLIKFALRICLKKKDKQWSTKHYTGNYKWNRTIPIETVDALRCSIMILSSCSTSDTCCLNVNISYIILNVSFRFLPECMSFSIPLVLWYRSVCVHINLYLRMPQWEDSVWLAILNWCNDHSVKQLEN
jgi:hypothetical protein